MRSPWLSPRLRRWLRLWLPIAVAYASSLAYLLLAGGGGTRDREVRYGASRQQQPVLRETPGPDVWSTPPGPDELGKQMAGIFRETKARLSPDPHIGLRPERWAGDFAIRAFLVPASSGTATGYPAGRYCFDCSDQQPFFHQSDTDALARLAAAFTPDQLRELAGLFGPELARRICVSFAARGDERPPRLGGVYRAAACGSQPCETMGGSRSTLRIGEGLQIGNNLVLACLRALCLRSASAIGQSDGEVPTRVVGLGETGLTAAHGIPSVSLTLRGIARGENSVYFDRFWKTFDRTSGFHEE